MWISEYLLSWILEVYFLTFLSYLWPWRQCITVCLLYYEFKESFIYVLSFREILQIWMLEHKKEQEIRNTYLVFVPSSWRRTSENSWNLWSDKCVIFIILRWLVTGDSLDSFRMGVDQLGPWLLGGGESWNHQWPII